MVWKCLRKELSLPTIWICKKGGGPDAELISTSLISVPLLLGLYWNRIDSVGLVISCYGEDISPNLLITPKQMINQETKQQNLRLFGFSSLLVSICFLLSLNCFAWVQLRSYAGPDTVLCFFFCCLFTFTCHCVKASGAWWRAVLGVSRQELCWGRWVGAVAVGGSWTPSAASSRLAGLSRFCSCSEAICHLWWIPSLPPKVYAQYTFRISILRQKQGHVKRFCILRRARVLRSGCEVSPGS